jgi:hypothetical protein
MINQQPVVSGFDKIKVNNDDEILIYHIADNNLPWSITALTTSADTAMINQTVEIQLKKYFSQMDMNRIVSINSLEVIAGQSIQVELKNQSNSKVILTTDEFGKALFMPKQSAEYLISSGIDAAKLMVETVTGNKPLLKNSLQCTVYPNPFIESITIECYSILESVQIFNMSGQLVFRESNPKSEIELKTLRSGVYILRATTGNRVFQQKIVKR